MKSISAPPTFTFDLHFAEWRTGDVVYLPTQGVSPNWWGNYAADTFPKPTMTIAEYKSGYFNYFLNNPGGDGPSPGSIGRLTYWTNFPGDPNPTREASMDSADLMKMWANWNNSY